MDMQGPNCAQPSEAVECFLPVEAKESSRGHPQRRWRELLTASNMRGFHLERPSRHADCADEAVAVHADVRSAVLASEDLRGRPSYLPLFHL